MNKRKAQVVLFTNAGDKSKHFLLLKMSGQRNFLWQNVTGSIEDNETFQEGAIREAIEETGLRLKNIKSIIESKLIFTFHDQWQKDVIEKVFAIECHDFWKIKLDSTEHCEYNWIKESELNESSVHYMSNYDALVWAKGLN